MLTCDFGLGKVLFQGVYSYQNMMAGQVQQE